MTAWEGPHKLIEEGARSHGTWAEANRHLYRIARVAPTNGSYYKTGVSFEWQDGREYGFRVDVTREHVRQFDPLARELKNELRFFSGRWRPAHLSEENYQKILEQFACDQAARERLGRILDECEIP